MDFHIDSDASFQHNQNYESSSDNEEEMIDSEKISLLIDNRVELEEILSNKILTKFEKKSIEDELEIIEEELKYLGWY